MITPSGRSPTRPPPLPALSPPPLLLVVPQVAVDLVAQEVVLDPDRGVVLRGRSRSLLQSRLSFDLARDLRVLDLLVLGQDRLW